MAMVAEIDRLLEDYRLWLKEKTLVREIDGTWVEITTPYLDRHNDALQIYAKRIHDGFLLSDDSYILHDLEASGCDLSKSSKRQALLNLTLKGFGVKLNEEALEIYATKETFPLRKHNLIQAMLAVNDLFCLAKPMVESLFLEDVTAWLDSVEVRYTPNVKFTGISGYDHRFDFVIPKSRREPERIVQAINRPTKTSVADFIFSWNDTREARSSDAQAYAILNDVGNSLSSHVEDALRNYGIHAVPWTRKFEAETKLAA
jgi:hypothetical protein